jgi:hypothetical protein
MNKKTWILGGGCFIAGLVIGHIVALAQAGKTVANTLAVVQLTETGEACNRAFQAYQHESSPVAIYALSAAVERLKSAEDFGATTLYTKEMMAFDGVMLHGRLARLYLAAGETNSCEDHVAEALKRAQNIPALQTVTNQTALMELIAKADRKTK